MQKPLKVINLWDYQVLILMEMLNFATFEKAKKGVQNQAFLSEYLIFPYFANRLQKIILTFATKIVVCLPYQ
ncbi:hypothetical protein ST41_00305 [Prevotella pectinovora]|nr:hypothetical protein ST41_00305 [Prevotella pectinovora]